jgi:prophage DNA circulation protein
MADNTNGSDYTGLLLEEVREDFRAVMEAVSDIQRQVHSLPEVRQNTRLLMDDTQALKVAVRGLSNEVGGLSDQVEHHEHRISHLEVA